jgi:hypothetical protein
MAEYKTPAVYIQEAPGFTNSVVEVETAVPVFIGYTEIAAQGANDLTNKPFRITSPLDFQTYYGGPPVTRFGIDPKSKNTNFDLSPADKRPLNESKFDFVEDGAGEGDSHGKSYVAHRRYYLYYALRLFFADGGGDCFVV